MKGGPFQEDNELDFSKPVFFMGQKCRSVRVLGDGWIGCNLDGIAGENSRTIVRIHQLYHQPEEEQEADNAHEPETRGTPQEPA